MSTDAVDARAQSPAQATTIPQKRKASEPPPAPDDYAAGTVACDACGASVAWRHPETGKLQIEAWNAHKRVCSGTGASGTDGGDADADGEADADADADADGDADEDMDAEGSPDLEHAELPPVPPSASAPPGAHARARGGSPPPKRRRAKRTEDERIEYLRADPYVARFEPYRVLCGACDKWIRLRPNSTYCSIPWDAHRKSCLAKKGVGTQPGPRVAALASDPTVRRVEVDRVQCRACAKWVHVGVDDGAAAAWAKHRAACDISSAAVGTSRASAPAAPAHPALSAPTTTTPPVASSSTAAPPPADAPRITQPVSAILAAASAHAAAQAHADAAADSRRKNAEQRAALLREDPLVAQAEPHRVFCALCQKWVQLRQDSTYCANPWQQHRVKCLVRAEKRERRARDEQGGGGAQAGAGEMAGASAVVGTHAHGAGRAISEPEVHTPSAGDPAMDVDTPTKMPSAPAPAPASTATRADLDSPPGRVTFIHTSVAHLYATTYTPADELTLAALLLYLNSAAPPDKHEDFDTVEVLEAAKVLQARGVLELQGDVLRPLALL